jgi:hypothetical protein
MDLPENPLGPICAGETVEVLKRVARRLEVDARAAVTADYRNEPDPARLREAKVLDSASLVLEVLLKNWPEVRSLVRRRRSAS